MLLRKMFLTLIAFGGMAGVSEADLYASPPTYGGFASQVTCRLFNAGAPVAIVSAQFFANGSTTPVPSTGDCSGILQTNAYCAIAVNAPGNFAYSCKVDARGADVHMTGAVDIFGNVGGGTPGTTSLPLQKF